jgi:hypothetical protein
MLAPLPNTARLRLATVATLFRNELRMVLRDRRTIVTSIILPLIVMPILLFGSVWTGKKREQTLQQTVYRYAVTGSQTNSVRALAAKTQERLIADAGTNANQFKFEETTVTNAPAALNNGDIHFFLEGLAANRRARRPPMQFPKAGLRMRAAPAAGRRTRWPAHR